MNKLTATLCLSVIALSCYAGGAKLNFKMKGGCKAKPSFSHIKFGPSGSANNNQQQQRKKKNLSPPPANWPWWLGY